MNYFNVYIWVIFDYKGTTLFVFFLRAIYFSLVILRAIICIRNILVYFNTESTCNVLLYFLSHIPCHCHLVRIIRSSWTIPSKTYLKIIEFNQHERCHIIKRPLEAPSSKCFIEFPFAHMFDHPFPFLFPF